MDEKNTTNSDEKNELKKDSKQKKEKKSDKPSFSETVADYKAEFKKIVWPNRPTVGKNTVTVILTSLLFGVIVFCMDAVYSTVYNLILGMLG